jgi:hypothetical protein
MMTAEEAAQLLELFRRDRSEAPPVSSRDLAYAYIAVLGSLRE